MQVNEEISKFLYEMVEGGKIPGVEAITEDAAKFWLYLSEALWDPEQRRQIARRVFARQDVEIMSHLAGAWIDLNPELKVNVAGVTLALKKRSRSCAWRQVMEWEGGGIRKNILKYMTGYKREMIDVDEAGRALVARGKERIDPRRAAVISIKNMNEVELRSSCNPTGSFRVKLPEEILLSQWGISALRVWVMPNQGMWVALEMDDRPQISFKWVLRKPHLQRWIIPETAIPTIHAVISALWRDLCVGGRSVMIDKGPGLNGNKLESTLGRVKFFGEIQWGSDEDFKSIMKEAHAVKWHLRELPRGKRVSWRAKKVAGKFGIELPTGTTFVRSHRRGAPDRNTKRVPIHAKGLGRLILGERNNVDINGQSVIS